MRGREEKCSKYKGSIETMHLDVMNLYIKGGLKKNKKRSKMLAFVNEVSK